MKSKEEQPRFSREEKKSIIKIIICRMIARISFGIFFLMLGFVFDERWIIILYKLSIPLYFFINMVYLGSRGVEDDATMYPGDRFNIKSHIILLLLQKLSFIVLYAAYYYMPDIALMIARANATLLTIGSCVCIITSTYTEILRVRELEGKEDY